MKKIDNPEFSSEESEVGDKATQMDHRNRRRSKKADQKSNKIGKVFKYRESLKKPSIIRITHKKVEIQNKENAVCENCGKSCTSMASLNVHLVVCKRPGYSNKQENSLVNDQKSVPTNCVKQETFQ